MIPRDEAANVPISPMLPAVKEEWELRVVVWKTRKVPLINGNSVDIFVTGELETMHGDKTEGYFPKRNVFSTDVDRGSKDGSGAFNWRMKFDCKIPSKLPRLKLQLVGFAY